MTTSLPAWMAEGVCAQADPEAFFPERGHSATDAKKLCMSCPVRGRCLDYALSNHERFGVWGGLSEHERSQLAANPDEEPISRGRDYSEVDRLMQSGEYTDSEIARLCQLPKSTIYRRREQLDLAPNVQHRTPLTVYRELTLSIGEGHRKWIGSRHTAVKGRHYRPNRLAFLAGYGREPEGHVYPTCGRADCVASTHLADRPMRAERAAA